MYTISTEFDNLGKGVITLKLGIETAGELMINLNGNELVLIETLVPVKRYLHCIGSRLMQEALEYARMHELKISTLSKFVKKQFSSNPSLYADV
jgi:predicted GNAT family acetyltransferase